MSKTSSIVLIVAGVILIIVILYLAVRRKPAPPGPGTGTGTPSCAAFDGQLTYLDHVTCDQARVVVNTSPPGSGQNYEPFQVPALGTWKTLDQLRYMDQQFYTRIDGGASFSYDQRFSTISENNAPRIKKGFK